MTMNSFCAGYLILGMLLCGGALLVCVLWGKICVCLVGLSFICFTSFTEHNSFDLATRIMSETNGVVEKKLLKKKRDKIIVKLLSKYE